MSGTYQRWPRVRDDLARHLRQHAERCSLCRPADGVLAGVFVHNGCEDGIVLLTEWHLAKCHAEAAAQIVFPANPQRTQSS